jgi:hypothetical protein
MIGLQASEGRIFCQSWWQMVTSLLDCQWKLVASQYQTGLKLTEAVLRMPLSKEESPGEGAEATSQIVDEFRRLERRAAERASQGLSPPREIYETPYRDRIDWSRLPEWARPSDPELYQGCGHEG